MCFYFPIGGLIRKEETGRRCTDRNRELEVRMSSASPSKMGAQLFQLILEDLGQILKYTQIHQQNFNAFRLVLSIVQNCTKDRTHAHLKGQFTSFILYATSGLSFSHGAQTRCLAECPCCSDPCNSCEIWMYAIKLQNGTRSTIKIMHLTCLCNIFSFVKPYNSLL